MGGAGWHRCWWLGGFEWVAGGGVDREGEERESREKRGVCVCVRRKEEDRYIIINKVRQKEEEGGGGSKIKKVCVVVLKNGGGGERVKK